MDAAEIGTLISTVGFPIVMAILMIGVIYKMNEEYRADIMDLRETVENNTTAIVQLTAYFMKGGSTDGE